MMMMMRVTVDIVTSPTHASSSPSTPTTPTTTLRASFSRCHRHVVIVVVGGAAEALDTKPGEYVLTLARRTGFFRLAIESGADLVPSFGFGENDIFDTYTRPGSFLRYVQTKMYKVMSFSTPFFYGRGVFTYNYGLLPYRRPLHVVVGDPIRVEKCENPSKEKVEEVKHQYIEALRRLYAEWAPRLEPGRHTQLIVV